MARNTKINYKAVDRYLAEGISAREIARKYDVAPSTITRYAKSKDKPPKPQRPKIATQTLTQRQKAFCDQYLIDLNATQSAIRAGYSRHTAKEQATRLLANVHVKQYLDERIQDRVDRTEITQDMVLERFWQIATADPNELIEYRRTCCRHCFGEGHAYQWVNEAEFQAACKAAEENDQPEPMCDGGFGFDPALKPHPKCPKCHGEGWGKVHAHDTKDASRQAKMLYAGVKQTKEGLEIKMIDQMAALNAVARHLGMFTEKVEHSGGITTKTQQAPDDDIDRAIAAFAAQAGVEVVACGKGTTH